MGIGNFICEEFGSLIKGAEEGDFSKLDVMHHLLSGYKSIFSERTLDSVEMCRKNCGGAGYSALSGLPNLYINFSPVPTYEGDNTVMLL
jgi:acyl-CoA oxidase